MYLNYPCNFPQILQYLCTFVRRYAESFLLQNTTLSTSKYLERMTPKKIPRECVIVRH